METEYFVLDALKDYHISPWPFYFNKDKKILVLEYIQHDNKEINLEDPWTRGKLLSLLHRIEDLNIEIPRFYHPSEEIHKFVELATASGGPLPELFYTEMLPALKKIEERLSNIQKWKLCHFDLCHKNILKNNDRLWIIDWEYAVMGDPLLNLASIASIQRWNDDQMEILLQNYISSPEKEDYHRLCLYRILTDIHWFLWNHIQNNLSKINAPYQVWSKLFFDAALERIKSSQYLEALTIN
jgi:thiamine kinase-like enzyme